MTSSGLAVRGVTDEARDLGAVSRRGSGRRCKQGLAPAGPATAPGWIEEGLCSRNLGSCHS